MQHFKTEFVHTKNSYHHGICKLKIKLYYCIKVYFFSDYYNIIYIANRSDTLVYIRITLNNMLITGITEWIRR